MNIFSALSEGRGRISETNLSAFLAFLLTPDRPHGLSDTFLRLFLKEVAERTGDQTRFDSILNLAKIQIQVGLEVRYSVAQASRIVDVEVKLFEKVDQEFNEKHRLFIENKIKSSTAQGTQFKEEFECVQADIDDGTKITAIFLTPSNETTVLRNEYEYLTLQDEPKHKKIWLKWNQQQPVTNEKSVIDLVREMLQKEANAEIEPVSEYTRHTLKAVVQFIEKLMAPAAPRISISLDDQEIISEYPFIVDGISYRLLRFADGAFKVFDEANGQECTAKPLLRRLNVQEQLNVSLELDSGAVKNTRRLGRDIMNRLMERAQ